MCKTVENGNSILMELKRATGHIQANLNNVQLRGVERLEKKMKDDRVTEHKYGMVFYTKVNVCNQIFPLRVRFKASFIEITLYFCNLPCISLELGRLGETLLDCFSKKKKKKKNRDANS